MKRDHGVGIHACLDDWIPVIAIPETRKIHRVWAFRKSYGDEAPLGVSVDLGDGEFRIGEIRDATRDDPSGMRRVPLLEEPIVPSAHACKPDFSVFGRREYTTTESCDLGGEIHLRPDPPEIHIRHPRVRVVATPSHLLETKRLELHRFGSPARDRVHSDLRIDGSFKLPDLVTIRCFDQLRTGVPERSRQIALEDVRRFDDVIINGDDRVFHLARIGIGQKKLWVERSGDHDDCPLFS